MGIYLYKKKRTGRIRLKAIQMIHKQIMKLTVYEYNIHQQEV